MAASSSKYGLFIPKKTSKGPVLKPTSANVFGDDSDEEGGASAVNESVNRESTRAKVRKQTQLAIDKALQEDPSVYEYDSIYDNLQAQKVTTDVKEANKVDRKPKYIAGLLKMAEVRKKEEERRIERKVQKEREEEGQQFADKEAFVTSAYKKKMQEQQEEAERERRQAAMEEMLDVTKQKDLSGFYRYLYRETTGTVPQDTEDATDKKEEKVKVKEEPHSDSENDRASLGSEKNRNASDAHGKHPSAKPRATRGSESENEATQKRSRSPTDRPKPDGSTRRRSRSRDRDRGHHHHRHKRSHSRSPSHSKRSQKNKHRSRSRDRNNKRDRQSRSPDIKAEKRRRSGGERQKEERDSSRKEEKRKRRHSSREEQSLSVEKTETPAKASSPTVPDASSSPEMLPARPPDDNLDLDRDDPVSESESSADEAEVTKRKGQGREVENSESRGGKKVEEPCGGGKEKKKEEDPVVKFARKTTEGDVMDARQRFLARKLARERARPVVEPE